MIYCGARRTSPFRPRRVGIQGIGFVVAALIFGTFTLPAVEIWEIQGPGMTSPLEGQRVTLSDNVVFAAGSTGFFMQTPDDRSDDDPQTSDGIFVYTGASPGVAVGDLVDVTATVVEYHELTELSETPEVSVRAPGEALPSGVLFNRHNPRPDQPWEETTLERFEGMRIVVDDGVVSAPTDSFGDAWATASEDRLRREPGIRWPGVEGLAVWDGNPEAFEIDPDALGLEPVDLVAGTRFRADGALTFAWGDYQLWPTRLDLGASPQLPRPAPPTQSSAIRVATQNLERLGRGLSRDYQVELAKDALQVVDVLGLPDVLAVQEVEDLETLGDLAAAVAELTPQISYEAFLVEGADLGGIDVGFLVRDTVTVESEIQIGADVVFDWDGSRLFDRPPLVLELGIEGTILDLTVVAVHLRSLRGIDDPGDGPRVRAKRDAQACWLADWAQSRQTQWPEEPLLLVGDFNAFEFSDGYVDIIGQITGSPDPLGAMLPAYVVVDPPLVDAINLVSSEERYTYVYQGNAQTLDHILVNRVALPLVVDLRVVRGNADASEAQADDEGTPLRSSDHDGLILTLNLSPARNPGSGGRSGGG